VSTPVLFVPKCAGCGLRGGHKMGCGIGRGHNTDTLPRRRPGRAIERPDRAHWPRPRHTRKATT
jgi:hypothetical protein